MAMALAHFAVGAALTALLVALLAPETRWSQALVALGGAWALVPTAIGVFDLGGPLATLLAGPLADLFWFSGVLETLDRVVAGIVRAPYVGPNAASRPFAGLALAFLVAGVVVLEHRRRALEGA